MSVKWRPGLDDLHAQTMAPPPATSARRRPLLGFASGFLLVFVIATIVYLARGGRVGAQADPTNATLVAEGQHVYATFCASCHGAQLEGQPNWKERLPSGLLPAPPHDASGHTWHHADRLLFKIVGEGSAAYLPAGEIGGMPAYQDVLTEDQIWAVLAYIKSTWPPEVREAQERANQQVR